MSKRSEKVKQQKLEKLKVGKVMSMNLLLKLSKGYDIYIKTSLDSFHAPLDRAVIAKNVKYNMDTYGEKRYWVKITHNFGLRSVHNCIHVEFINHKKTNKDAKSKNLHRKSQSGKRVSKNRLRKSKRK